MPFYKISIRRPDGEAEWYNFNGSDPRDAAAKALVNYENYIRERISMSVGSLKRRWAGNKIPRLVEVSDGTGKVVGKFGAKESSVGINGIEIE